MDNEHRLTVEEFKKMLDAVDDNSRFIRVFDTCAKEYKDIEAIRLYGNTVMIQVK